MGKIQNQNTVSFMPRNIFLIACIASILLALPTIAHAHPHVFVDVKLQFVFDSSGISGMQEEWSFDDMFSEWIVADYDANRDKVFDRAETEKIYREVFSQLKAERFFHEVSVNGSKKVIANVERFSVSVSDHRVQFVFFVPLPVPAGSSEGVVKLSLNDPTIYTDLVFAKGSPSAAGNAQAYRTNFSRAGGKQPDGHYVPETITLRFGRR